MTSGSRFASHRCASWARAAVVATLLVGVASAATGADTAARVRDDATVEAARATLDIHERLARDPPDDPHAPTRDRRSLEAVARENGVGRLPDAAGDAVPAVIRILDDLATRFHASGSRRLAAVVHGRLVREVSALSPLLDPRVRKPPFDVPVGSEMPAMLAEVASITHPDEGSRLEAPAYQDTIASALAHGVLTSLDPDRRWPGGPG